MKKTIYLAGGCFWGMQAYFQKIQGILSTECGYANGNTVHPSYEEVCRNNTGHAETVKIEYEDTVLPLKNLLRYYFRVIDPTSREMTSARSTARESTTQIRRTKKESIR